MSEGYMFKYVDNIDKSCTAMLFIYTFAKPRPIKLIPVY